MIHLPPTEPKRFKGPPSDQAPILHLEEKSEFCGSSETRPELGRLTKRRVLACRLTKRTQPESANILGDQETRRPGEQTSDQHRQFCFNLHGDSKLPECIWFGKSEGGKKPPSGMSEPVGLKQESLCENMCVQDTHAGLLRDHLRRRTDPGDL